MKNKLIYVCYYGNDDLKDKIVTYPSVWSKIDYIIDCLQEQYYVEVLSVARSIKGRFRGCTEKSSNKKIKYLSSCFSRGNIINRIFIFIHWLKIILYLLINAKNNTKVLVYHSLDNLWWLKIYRKVFKRKFYLEIEDVFSMLTSQNEKFAKREFECFNNASGCLCVNDLVFEKLSTIKNKIISYGNYSLPPKFKINKQPNQIKLVYAGVIEQERNAAFLAVKTMNYLPNNYSLDILGFGAEKDINELNKLIQKTRENTSNINIHYRGVMFGEKYYRFLQSCDIGLSTHMYDESNINSADNTFPSKILVYLGNDLIVVAQNIRCLKKCYMKDYIKFYNIPDPYQVAECIMNIEFKNEQSGRKLLLDMDRNFRKRIINLIES